MIKNLDPKIFLESEWGWDQTKELGLNQLGFWGLNYDFYQNKICDAWFKPSLTKKPDFLVNFLKPWFPPP